MPGRAWGVLVVNDLVEEGIGPDQSVPTADCGRLAGRTGRGTSTATPAGYGTGRDW